MFWATRCSAPSRGGWIGRALFKWILDFEGTLLIALIAACAAVGVVVGIASERESR